MDSIGACYLQNGIEDTSGKDQLASKLSMLDLFQGQSRGFRIVGSPYQNEMHKGHSNQQGDDASHHDQVFREEPFEADKPATNPNKDDDKGKARRPPAHQEGWVGVLPTLKVGRCLGPDVTAQ